MIDTAFNARTKNQPTEPFMAQQADRRDPDVPA